MKQKTFYKASFTIDGVASRNEFFGHSKRTTVEQVAESAKGWYVAKFGVAPTGVKIYDTTTNPYLSTVDTAILPAELNTFASKDISTREFSAKYGFVPNNFDDRTKLSNNKIIECHGTRTKGAQSLRDLVGMKIVALRRYDNGKVNGEVEYMLLDDGVSFMSFTEQDRHDYHDCSWSARTIQVEGHARRWKDMMDFKGYLEPTSFDF